MFSFFRDKAFSITIVHVYFYIAKFSNVQKMPALDPTVLKMLYFVFCFFYLLHDIMSFCFQFQSLLDLHKLAGTHDDVQMQDFIESHFLTEQVEAIKEIGEHITRLKRNGPGVGEFLYDKELQS